jgi:hypothetical protein
MSSGFLRSNPDKAVAVKNPTARPLQTFRKVAPNATGAVQDGSEGRVRDGEFRSGHRDPAKTGEVVRQDGPLVGFCDTHTCEVYATQSHMQEASNTLRVVSVPERSYAVREPADKIDLAERMNARRIALGLTYDQVHERLARYNWPEGVDVPASSTVGHWFNGTRRPRHMEHLRGLLSVLEMDIAEALGGTPREAVTAIEQALLSEMRGMDTVSAELLLAMAKKLSTKQTA